MDAQAGLIVDLEEDLGLSELAPENDQRASVFFCHLELIRCELGFLGELDEEFLVPPPGIPTRMARRDLHLSLGRCWDRNPGLCATGFFSHTGGIATKISRVFPCELRCPVYPSPRW